MITPIILSGGSGTRLWPLSRTQYPKQFISLINETSLFQDTILRLPNRLSNPLIICNESHRFIAAEQMRQINIESSGVILEPVGKNTAPAVALAAIKAMENLEDPILLVLSADHLIYDKKTFHESIKIAKRLAENDKLVTFGITPLRPETGYGYIEADIINNNDHLKVKSFKEKPILKDAKKYIATGNYFWNSGMFMFKASTYLKELEKFEPDILLACKSSLKSEYKDSDFIRLIDKEFLKCPDKSIDYAVMERTKNSVVVPLSTEWNDVGSWSSLYEIKNKDLNNNVSEGDVMLEDVNNSYIYSSNRLISAIGVSNLVIVDTPDALLVANKKNTQDIKKIVERLKKDNRNESNDHRKVYRPWGHYDSIDSGDGFQVKRILINPKAKISLQKHNHRSEHWVVIKGNALITCGNDKFTLKANQSTYIAQGEVHRLENLDNTPLEIIEIQTGSYLGEDDIIRLDDDYERN